MTNYFDNQSDELGDILKGLILSINNLKDFKKVDDTIEKVNLGLLKILNLNIEDITNSPMEHFIGIINAEKKLNNHSFDLLAELFFNTAHLLKEQSKKELAKRLYSRSLLIYQYLLKAEEDFTYERHIQIKKLKEILLQ